MFNPLETVLISFMSALVVGLLVKHYAGRDTVSCEACQKHRDAMDAEMDSLRTDQEEIAAKDKLDHAMMLRMLRSIVLHLEIPSDKKEAILNDNGGHK